jgi:hypothetical protein
MLLAVNFHYMQPGGRYPYPGTFLTATEYRSVFFDEIVLVERGGV